MLSQVHVCCSVRYQQLVISIKTLLDIDNLSMKEITTHVNVVEDDGGVP
jgi:hypothetical protein